MCVLSLRELAKLRSSGKKNKVDSKLFTVAFYFSVHVVLVVLDGDAC
jgi:hypothetical protein